MDSTQPPFVMSRPDLVGAADPLVPESQAPLAASEVVAVNAAPGVPIQIAAKNVVILQSPAAPQTVSQEPAYEVKVSPKGAGIRAPNPQRGAGLAIVAVSGVAALGAVATALTTRDPKVRAAAGLVGFFSVLGLGTGAALTV